MVGECNNNTYMYIPLGRVIMHAARQQQYCQCGDDSLTELTM